MVITPEIIGGSNVVVLGHYKFLIVMLLTKLVALKQKNRWQETHFTDYHKIQKLPLQLASHWGKENPYQEDQSTFHLFQGPVWFYVPWTKDT